MEQLKDRNVLIVGGGVAGLHTAFHLSRLGVNVLLVEKQSHLGGHGLLLHEDSLTGDSIKDLVKAKVEAVRGIPGIRVLTNTVVSAATRKGTCFNVTLQKVPEDGDETTLTVIEADAIVVATGFNLFDASRMRQYGYGRYKDVMNNLDFEKLRDPDGPTGGKVLRPSNGKAPRSIVFITCVGSRDVKHSTNCCRIGCPVTLSQALSIKKGHGGDTEVYVCYIDIRAVGRGVEESYRKAMEAEVIFIQGQPSEIRPGDDGSLRVEIFDESTGKLLSLSGDLIVLATGISPNTELSETLGLDIDQDGFYRTEHSKFETCTMSVPGIFLAGAAEGPKDIGETLIHASRTALKVVEYLAGLT